MKTKLHISFLLLLIYYYRFSSAQITFQKSFGAGWAGSAQQTSDGGYIIASAIGLIKTNVSGDTLWTKTYAGVEVETMEQTNDEGFIITGATVSFGAGNYDVCLLKADSNGNLLWSKTYGGTENDLGYSVQQTSDSGYVITGITSSFGAGFNDVYLIKTNAIGDTLWTKTYGGANSESGNSVHQTSDNGFIITGFTYSFGEGEADVYFIKTNVNGDTLWTKTYGDSLLDSGTSGLQTSDGGFIILGDIYSAPNDDDFCLIKTDSAGNIVWQKGIDGGASTNNTGYYIRQTSDGGYIIIGNIGPPIFGYSDIYVVKTNSNGDVLWAESYGIYLNDRGSCVQQTSDGGFIITGSTTNMVTGGGDTYLIKTDTNGNSGCNDSYVFTYEYIISKIVTSPATIVSTTNTIVTSPSTIGGSGCSVTNHCFAVGINEIIPENSFISPNPFFTSATLTINSQFKFENAQLKIYDTMGKEIAKHKIVKQKTEISRGNLSSGIYFYNVQNENEIIGSGKLIIQ